jgi:hypothetical protein
MKGLWLLRIFMTLINKPLIIELQVDSSLTKFPTSFFAVYLFTNFYSFKILFQIYSV